MSYHLNRVLILLLFLLPLMFFPPSIPLISLLSRPLFPLLAFMPVGFRSPGSIIGGYAPDNGSISAAGESGNGSRDSLQIMDLLPFPILSSLLILWPLKRHEVELLCWLESPGSDRDDDGL
jgi:hypothetical protein